MNSLRYAIPSLFTCLAILAGCISVTFTSLDNLTWAAYFVLAAAILDYIDGFLARSLDAITPFGKQIDSLSDVICFGVAPSLIMYRLIYRSLVELEPTSQFNLAEPGFTYYVLLNMAFLLAVFTAIRLARFNIDPEQESHFRGLPTPASGLFVASLGFTAENHQLLPLHQLTYNIWFLMAIVIMLSALMVSRLSMFSLKFKSFSLADNKLRYLFLIISLVLVSTLGLPAIVLIVIIYILLSAAQPHFSPKLSKR